MSERVELITADGLTLDAELERPGAGAPDGAVVLCHPHPQYGGNMRSLVISELFAALPGAGYASLRFNFRGVEASEGVHSGGTHEPLDVEAAVSTLAAQVADDLPLWLTGWSFGADMALSVTAARVCGWVAIAPPMRLGRFEALGADPRRKHIVLGEHDELVSAADVERVTAPWRSTTTCIVAGASHFFVGRTDRVVAEVLGVLSNHGPDAR